MSITNTKNYPKIALVYDRINAFGGAERVLLALHEIWPEAPIYTSVVNYDKTPWSHVFPEIIPSFLQEFPFAKDHHEFYPFLMPLAFESFTFDKYDLVISITSEAGKGNYRGCRTIFYQYIDNGKPWNAAFPGAE